MKSGELIQKYLQLLDAKYPNQLDAGLNAAMRKYQDKQDITKTSHKKNRKSKEIPEGEADDAKLGESLFEFVALTFRGTSHQMLEESSTTLCLALQHPDHHVRLMAVDKIANVLTSSDLELSDSEVFFYISPIGSTSASQNTNTPKYPCC